MPVTSEPQDTAPTETLRVARALARSHGLGDHRGDEHLKPWMRDAATAVAAFATTQASEADVERVARALFNHEWSGMTGPEAEWQSSRDYWLAAAEVAIEAVKELGDD